MVYIKIFKSFRICCCILDAIIYMFIITETLMDCSSSCVGYIRSYEKYIQ